MDRQRAVIGTLLALGVTAAIALSIRALRGPLQVGSFHIGSPLPLESAFALVFLGLLLFRGRRSKSLAQSLPPVSSRPPLLLLVAALAVIACAFSANLGDPFLSDDYIQVNRASLDSARIFVSFHTAGGDGAFRPIGNLYFDLIGAAAHTDPLRWRLFGLALHLFNCALLYLIVWNLWPGPLLPPASALLFGLHGTRPEVVAWTSGGFDLLACGFTLAAAYCILRKRAAVSYGAVALAVALLVLAILSKENAYAAPLVVLGLAAAAGRLRDWPVRAFFWTALFTCALLFAYRWALFAGPGGYVDPATGRSRILSLHLLTAAKAILVRVWAILLFPVNWEAGAGLWLAAALLIGCGALLFACCAGAPLPLRVSACLLAITIGPVLPAIHLALIGDTELGSRILYLPSVGFCILCGHLVLSLPSRRRVLASLIALSLCTLVVLIHNLGAWHRVSRIADDVCAAEAARGSGPSAIQPQPPGTLQGVVFFANGFPECVAMHRAKIGR